MKKRLLLSFILILSQAASLFAQSQRIQGAWVRGDTSKSELSLVFTGHEFAEGGWEILETLRTFQVKGAFFFTGDFYRNPDFAPLIKSLKDEGHYLGAHSDQHLLYCDWDKRDSLLVDKATFLHDLQRNYAEMAKFGVSKEEAPYFLPPYEWYNDSISHWTKEAGLQLINFSYGTRSHADYTEPGMPNYIGSQQILDSIWQFEKKSANGLNGFILLSHIGAGEKRTDKFFRLLPDLIKGLQMREYGIIPLYSLLPLQ